ncbi:predicted protein [Plenodomus lingam JN3]|uniref:Predicted protein n=1 Tax=Leptosphaeria maculans (strain JN3 / isolate v23.1.3 / race Av1-4-5-6-7-8) TaxID=985895 RepID=E4ZX29_LEPMJ|nr:predicted protein [Plenodomus lingam JN3]CBX95239.1 predicted protein [Plenodomus lingam JN3]
MRESFAALLRTGAGKLALSLLIASPTATAYTFRPVPSPNLELTELGRIAFTGDFDSISLYEYEGQSQQYPGRNGALLSRYPNGVFATINVTDADIKAMCSLQINGAERVVFAGNFTSVGPMQTPGGIALLDPTNGNVDALTGLDGTANTLYCDRDNEQIYVGGVFTGKNSSNAIIWKDGWQDLSFNGFNGPINSIVRAPNGNLIFAGEFNGLGSVNATVSAENNTQTIPVGNARISAQTSSGLPGLTDPRNIACKSDFSTQGPDQTWLLADTSPGFWKADFGFGFEPTHLKLWNTDIQGRGTKTFRFTALPDGGILNMTYVDPATGRKAYCDARCPLPQGNTTVQDFTFVNVVGMNSFRIDISDWYGQGAGLNGIQLLQEAMYSYAINDFNEPENCGSSGARSEATSTGPWQYEKLAAFAGMSNHRSASNAWAKLKAKLITPTDGTAPPATPKKANRKKALQTDDGDQDEPTPKKTATPRKRAAKKQDVDGDLASPKKKSRAKSSVKVESEDEKDGTSPSENGPEEPAVDEI